MVLSWVDAFGYAASSLTLATFAQRAMLPMRWLALCANICFIAYGALGMYMPVLVLHLVLLPINLVRLRALRGERMAKANDQESMSTSPPGVSGGLVREETPKKGRSDRRQSVAAMQKVDLAHRVGKRE